MTELPWGRRYLMVEPTSFRVDYAINPFMDTADQPDPGRTRSQWVAIREAIGAAGGTVEVLAQRDDAPDMVYAMNLGLVAGRRAALSHMRYSQRRMEGDAAQAWFAAGGWDTRVFGRGGVGPFFEAGDAFCWRGELVVGHGPRTEELALKSLAAELDVAVRGVRITHPGMYHLDLGFCPLDDRRAMVCPAAFDDHSARELLAVVPEPLVLSEPEAMTFCANSVVVGNVVVMPACPTRVRHQLESWGFQVVVVDCGEFLKGGGAIRCLTNPLDLAVGEDPAAGLVRVGGGRVIAG